MRGLLLVVILVVLAPSAWAQQSHPEAIGWTRDGRLVAACGADGAYVFEAASGRQICKITPPALPTGVALSPDGTTLAVGTLGSRIFTYSVPQGRQLREMQGEKRFGGGFGLTFSADARWLISTGFSIGKPTPDVQVRVWDVKTGAIIGSLPGPRGDVSPQGGWLAAFNPVTERVLVQAVPAGQRRPFNGARLPYTPFRSDDKRVAIVDTSDRQLKLVDPQTGTSTSVLAIDDKKAICGMSPDFLYAVVSHVDQDREQGDIEVVTVTRLKDRRRMAEVRGKHVRATLISARGVVAVEDLFAGQIKLLSAITGKPVGVCKGGSYAGVHEYLQYGFSGDGRAFGIVDTEMGQSGQSLRIFDGLTGRVRWTKPL